MSLFIPFDKVLPPKNKPVIVAWKESPWFTDGRSDIYRNAVALDDDNEWYEYVAEMLLEWDKDEWPTHWMEFPVFKEGKT